jgi:hypothetical protein
MSKDVLDMNDEEWAAEKKRRAGKATYNDNYDQKSIEKAFEKQDDKWEKESTGLVNKYGKKPGLLDRIPRGGDKTHEKIWNMTGGIRNKIREMATYEPPKQKQRKLSKKERRAIHKAQRERSVPMNGLNDSKMTFGAFGVQTQPTTQEKPGKPNLGFNHAWADLNAFDNKPTKTIREPNYGFNHAWASPFIVESKKRKK